ncbi:TPA: DUF655 domain-containing protein [Candidatus Micrarchaeota archaeon]|nr:MAG: hypothetical protein AUJ65_00730 [Candidatus Micrarchaeota archaeon CG1_02_51_15]HII39422.1 DUF655 domain-containing protein [Candidatus Micrarchaeota archaeon]
MIKREEYGLVLDFLPHGRSAGASPDAIVQVVGEMQFTLLEVTLKQGMQAREGERVYLGRDEREKVERIIGRITFDDLTNSAQNALHRVVPTIIRTREAEFVQFLNRAGAVNIRCHSLEMLPSIGKKHLQSLLDARAKQPFTSFKDIQARVTHIRSVEQIIADRVFEELRGTSKYYLFAKPARTEEDRRY